MSKVLLKTTITYVVDTEKEAEVLVDEFKKGDTLVIDTNIKRKVKKDDEYFVVRVTTENCTEKDSRSTN